MLQLRRVTDQVFNRRASDLAASGLAEARARAEEVRERGAKMAQKAYGYAMNHRKATAAVVLGTSITAALIYMVNRNGGYAAMRKKVLQRVRGASGSRSRARRRAAEAQ